MACSSIAPARRQQAAALREVGVQVLMPDGLDHLDRHQGVVLAVQIAIVLQQQRDPIRQDPARATRSRAKSYCSLRDGGGGDAAAVVLRRMDGEAAPAGADLEQVLSGLQRSLLQAASNLARDASRSDASACSKMPQE